MSDLTSNLLHQASSVGKHLRCPSANFLSPPATRPHRKISPAPPTLSPPPLRETVSRAPRPRHTRPQRPPPPRSWRYTDCRARSPCACCDRATSPPCDRYIEILSNRARARLLPPNSPSPKTSSSNPLSPSKTICRPGRSVVRHPFLCAKK